MSQFLFKRFQDCLTAVIFGSCSAEAVVQPLLLRALEDFLKVTPKNSPKMVIPPILNKNGVPPFFCDFLRIQLFDVRLDSPIYNQQSCVETLLADK